MICTSPRIPACPNQATDELLSVSTGSHLGYNCKSCIEPLLKAVHGKVDYASKPLDPPATP